MSRALPGALDHRTDPGREPARPRSSVVRPGDRTHVLKGYAAWTLPFGRGRRYLSSSSAFTEALAGGWTISAIVRYESGVPLAVRSSNAYAGWQYPIYANRVPDVPLDPTFDGDRFDISNPADAGNQYFNPRAFANPAYGELGAGPGRFAELRGFGAAYEDIGIIKDIRFAAIRFSCASRFSTCSTAATSPTPRPISAVPTSGRSQRRLADAATGSARPPLPVVVGIT